MCVCEREIEWVLERERKRGRGTKSYMKRIWVCEWVWEREREENVLGVGGLKDDQEDLTNMAEEKRLAEIMQNGINELRRLEKERNRRTEWEIGWQQNRKASEKERKCGNTNEMIEERNKEKDRNRERDAKSKTVEIESEKGERETFFWNPTE